jgi:hypothetical protein
MKVKLLITANVNGTQYAMHTIADLPVKDARALIRGGLAQEVKERAVPQKEVETRVAD